jgi:hypothetical protein
MTARRRRPRYLRLTAMRPFGRPALLSKLAPHANTALSQSIQPDRAVPTPHRRRTVDINPSTDELVTHGPAVAGVPLCPR